MDFSEKHALKKWKWQLKPTSERSIQIIQQDTYLGHFFSVSFGVQWGFGEKNWVLFWGHTELIVEGVMPDLNKENYCLDYLYILKNMKQN